MELLLRALIARDPFAQYFLLSRDKHGKEIFRSTSKGHGYTGRGDTVDNSIPVQTGSGG